jgi:hypothetical protein
MVKLMGESTSDSPIKLSHGRLLARTKVRVRLSSAGEEAGTTEPLFALRRLGFDQGRKIAQPLATLPFPVRALYIHSS